MKRKKTIPVVVVLRKARKVILRGWCQRGYARDAEGEKVAPKDEKAVAWCAIGALTMASGSDGALYNKGITYLGMTCRRHRQDGCIHYYNDAEGRTKEEVIAFYDEAITLCKERNKDVERIP